MVPKQTGMQTVPTTRRDFLYIATGAAGAFAAGGVLWPIVQSMGPSASTLPVVFGKVLRQPTLSSRRTSSSRILRSK